MNHWILFPRIEDRTLVLIPVSLIAVKERFQYRAVSDRLSVERQFRRLIKEKYPTP